MLDSKLLFTVNICEKANTSIFTEKLMSPKRCDEPRPNTFSKLFNDITLRCFIIFLRIIQLF